MYKYLIIFLSVFLWACGSGHDESGEHDGHEDHEEHADEHAQEEHGHSHEGIVLFSKHQAEAGGVQIGQVKAAEFNGVIRCSGEVLPAQGQERTVSAPVAGMVSFAGSPLSVGAAVGAGQTLFTISTRGIVQNDQGPELRAALKGAEANLARVKAQYEDKLVTKAEYDAAVAAVDAARAALTNPGAHAVRGGSASSPISGYVAECLVKPGDYVEVGAPLARIATNQRLQLRAEVPQRYSNLLSNIVGANIVLPFRPDDPISLSALNFRLVSYGKGSSGALYIPVTIEFNNPGGMAAGSPAEVYLLNGHTSPALIIPRSALTEEEGLYFVYVETQPEHYRKQQVEVGCNDGVNVEILSGLKEGEKIVVKGATLLKLAANSGKAPQGHTHNH